MSLFQCENCGVVENTALALQGFDWKPRLFNWDYALDRKGMKLCSECGPTHFNDGTPTKTGGVWHDEFDKKYYPIGTMETGPDGNLKKINGGGPSNGQ